MVYMMMPFAIERKHQSISQITSQHYIIFAIIIIIKPKEVLCISIAYMKNKIKYWREKKIDKKL
jgi:hypothetical protein